MIPAQLLNQYGAQLKSYEIGDFIFREQTKSYYYFQIVTGKVKLNNVSEDGKEFIQNIFQENQSFGEAELFIDEVYPSNAMTLEKTEVLQLPKNDFFRLLQENPQYNKVISENISRRLYYKMLMSQQIFSQHPAARITALMDYFKHIHSLKTILDPYLIPLTRQQIANLTGLRVETVIRTVKKMEKEGVLKIINRQIFY